MLDTEPGTQPLTSLSLVEQTGGEREQEAVGPGAQGRCSARDSPTMPGASAHPDRFLRPGTKRNSLPPGTLLSSARKRWSCPHLHRRCMRYET